MAPLQSLSGRVKCLILREQKALSGKCEQLPLSIGTAGIEDLGNVPVVIGARSDEIPVHRPVVVLAECEAIGGVVVLVFGKRNEMGGIDEGDIVNDRQFDAEATGGALMIVDGEDLAAESGRTTVFERLVSNER